MTSPGEEELWEARTPLGTRSVGRLRPAVAAEGAYLADQAFGPLRNLGKFAGAETLVRRALAVDGLTLARTIRKSSSVNDPASSQPDRILRASIYRILAFCECVPWSRYHLVHSHPAPHRPVGRPQMLETVWLAQE